MCKGRRRISFEFCGGIILKTACNLGRSGRMPYQLIIWPRTLIWEAQKIHLFVCLAANQRRESNWAHLVASEKVRWMRQRKQLHCRRNKYRFSKWDAVAQCPSSFKCGRRMAQAEKHYIKLLCGCNEGSFWIVNIGHRYLPTTASKVRRRKEWWSLKRVNGIINPGNR